MENGTITINTWDIINILTGVVIYVLVLMATNNMPSYVTRLAVASMWLLYVSVSMLLQNAADRNVDPSNIARVTRAVNLLNLGMSLCAMLYEISIVLTRTQSPPSYSSYL